MTNPNLDTLLTYRLTARQTAAICGLIGATIKYYKEQGIPLEAPELILMEAEKRITDQTKAQLPEQPIGPDSHEFPN